MLDFSKYRNNQNRTFLLYKKNGLRIKQRIQMNLKISIVHLELLYKVWEAISDINGNDATPPYTNSRVVCVRNWEEDTIFVAFPWSIYLLWETHVVSGVVGLCHFLITYSAHLDQWFVSLEQERSRTRSSRLRQASPSRHRWVSPAPVALTYQRFQLTFTCLFRIILQ